VAQGLYDGDPDLGGEGGAGEPDDDRETQGCDEYGRNDGLEFVHSLLLSHSKPRLVLELALQFLALLVFF
jgi:hypothetical protein